MGRDEGNGVVLDGMQWRTRLEIARPSPLLLRIASRGSGRAWGGGARVTVAYLGSRRVRGRGQHKAVAPCRQSSPGSGGRA